ncbi:MAG TPA: polyribonucleotide nucleotidyltransferase, partial [Alphaproteobacteria bacterium]|nr:polyribonucleotide nucleotidyltransferase [Alphaproteobacteria bacterium]
MSINFDYHKVELNWGGQPLTLETGKVARQADGAVVATLGETVVLATVVSAKEAKPGQDFFPLTVNYQEKYFAAGKIPGGYFKREGRPTEAETLISRLIDRPIRPLFPDGYRNETQVIVTVLQHDMENSPDVLAMVAASAALTLSGIPFMGPVGAARVGYIDGQYVLNTPIDKREDSKLDLVMAGTAEAVLMVESEAQELSEEVMLGAVMFGHQQSRKVIEAIIKLAELAAKDPREFSPPDHSALEQEMLGFIEEELRAAYRNTKKDVRYAAVDAARAKVQERFAPRIEAGEVSLEDVNEVFHNLQAKIVRWNILDTGLRIDGRDLRTVRPILAEVGVLPRTHGSALFTRGETQALVVATLGTGEDEQYVDTLEGTKKENFLLHYNFPPYSVGEAGRLGSP